MYEKQLPRTEIGLQRMFDCEYNQLNENSIKKCLEVADKMKKKGWTKSWFYQAIVKPYVAKHSSVKVTK